MPLQLPASLVLLPMAQAEVISLCLAASATGEAAPGCQKLR